MPAATTIGPRLREARVDAGLSQKAVAKALDVPQSRVSTWENGYGSPPSAPHRIRLADLLGLEADDLVAEIDHEPPTIPLYLNVREVAVTLRVSPTTIYKAIGLGRLPVLRVGRNIRIPVEAVEAVKVTGLNLKRDE